MLTRFFKLKTYLRFAKNVPPFYIDALFQTKMELCIRKSASTLDVDALFQIQNVFAFYEKCVSQTKM